MVNQLEHRHFSDGAVVSQYAQEGAIMVSCEEHNCALNIEIANKIPVIMINVI